MHRGYRYRQEVRARFYSSVTGSRGDPFPTRPMRFGSPLPKVCASRRTPQKTNYLPAIPFSPTVRTADVSTTNTALAFARLRSQTAMGNPLYYRVPLLIVESRGQYVFDQKGQRYLDLFGGDGTVVVGHTHPLVVKAVQSQMLALGALSQHYLDEVSSSYIKVAVCCACPL